MARCVHVRVRVRVGVRVCVSLAGKGRVKVGKVGERRQVSVYLTLLL